MDKSYHNHSYQKQSRFYKNDNNTSIHGRNRSRFLDPDTEYLLAGAGILLLDKISDELGFWVSTELDHEGNLKYTDFGGKYDYNDGDIYATITREFREETYNTREIPFKVAKQIPKSQHVYICGWTPKPQYLCVILDVRGNKDYVDYVPDDDEIKEARVKILKTNPNISPTFYKSIGTKFIPFSKIFGDECGSLLHLRLKEILEKYKKNNPAIENSNDVNNNNL
jgi:hypothetical protein